MPSAIDHRARPHAVTVCSAEVQKALDIREQHDGLVLRQAQLGLVLDDDTRVGIRLPDSSSAQSRFFLPCGLLCSSHCMAAALATSGDLRQLLLARQHGLRFERLS